MSNLRENTGLIGSTGNGQSILSSKLEVKIDKSPKESPTELNYNVSADLDYTSDEGVSYRRNKSGLSWTSNQGILGLFLYLILQYICTIKFLSAFSSFI